MSEAWDISQQSHQRFRAKSEQLYKEREREHGGVVVVTVMAIILHAVLVLEKTEY